MERSTSKKRRMGVPVQRRRDCVGPTWDVDEEGGGVFAQESPRPGTSFAVRKVPEGKKNNYLNCFVMLLKLF
jgi:hypothetical protein